MRSRLPIRIRALKIAFDARLLGSLGIGRYIGGLLPHLATLLPGRLVVLSRKAEVAMVRALTGGGADLITADAAPYRLAEQTTLLATLLGVRPALVHFPHYNLPIAYPGAFVVTIHDLFSFRFPEIHSGLVPRLLNQALIGNAVRRSRAIITPSQATAQDIRARYPSAVSRVVPIAEAAEGRFTAQRNAAAESAWLRYLGIRAPYFLFLGQWKPYKNVPLLIEAFSQVLATRPDVRLVIAGHDARYDNVRSLGAALPQGSVVFPGHLPDDAVPDLYRAAAAVVVPSRAEGFGLPVLEAMACGTPVIASDIPVLREIADGVASFADPNDAEAFAAAMLEVLPSANLSHPIATLPPPPAGEGRGGGPVPKGVERARHFSWRHAAEETVAVYERVLAGRERTRSATD